MKNKKTLRVTLNCHLYPPPPPQILAHLTKKKILLSAPLQIIALKWIGFTMVQNTTIARFEAPFPI